MTKTEQNMTPAQRRAHERAMTERDRIDPADEHLELVEWLGERKAGLAMATPNNQLGVNIYD